MLLLNSAIKLCDRGIHHLAGLPLWSDFTSILGALRKHAPPGSDI
jgi:hypothetical protein